MRGRKLGIFTVRHALLAALLVFIFLAAIDPAMAATINPVEEGPPESVWDWIIRIITGGIEIGLP